MNRFLILLPVLLIIINSGCRSSHPAKFNLGFEQVKNGMPEQWTSFGDDKYEIGVDRQNADNGKYAAYIEYKPGTQPGFKAIALEIPGTYEGKQITLSADIKTENVTGGYAGLWLRIDPDIAFDNMYNRGVTGTTDWKNMKSR